MENMLQACVLEFQGSWVLPLALVEIAYNNSYHASIGMTPYEAFYGRKCQTPFCWDDIVERKLENVELIEAITKKIKIIRDRLKVTQDRKKSYVVTRKTVLEFEVEDMVFLKIAFWKGVIRFQKQGKLNPWRTFLKL